MADLSENPEDVPVALELRAGDQVISWR